MMQIQHSFRVMVLLLTASAGCSGRLTAFSGLDGSPEVSGGGAGAAGNVGVAGSGGALGGGAIRDAGGDSAMANSGGSSGNGGVDATADGQAPAMCPKPTICHEFIAGDNARNAISYVNEFDPSKNWRKPVGDTGVNSPRTIEIVSNSRAKTQRVALVSVNRGYDEFDLTDGTLLVRMSNFSGVRGSWRLPDETTALAIDNRLVLVTGTGSEIRSVLLPVGVSGLVNINRNPVDGSFWIVDSHTVYALGPDASSILWKGDLPLGVNGGIAWPRPGGGAYVTTGNQATLVEIDANGRVLNTVGDEALYPELDYFGGFQPLPNGNFVIANWLGHLANPDNRPHVVEFTPTNQLVWKWGTQVEAREIMNVYVFR